MKKMLKMKKFLSAMISGMMMLSVVPSTVMANTEITIATTDGKAAEVGNTLRAEVTNPTGDVTYVWMADGEAIEGAEGQEFVLTYEQFGKTVSCMAVDENDAYASNELEVVSDFDKHVDNTFANFTVATLGTEKTGFGNEDWEFEMVNPYGSTMSFSLLDIQNNKEGKYYILANDYYTARSNNSNNNAAIVNTVYNPELPGTVAYNANYGYTSKNGSQWSLPDAMADAVDTDHVWITEKAYEGSITEAYTFKAGVVAPAIWEMREYIDRIKVDIRKSNQISTKHSMWLRTALKDNHYHSVYPDPDNDGDYNEDMVFQSGTTSNWQFRLNALHIANSTGYLRAEFFLNEDFFKNGKINLATAGANVLAEISKHSYEDLSKIYTEEEIVSYLNVTIPSDARAQITAADGGEFEVGNRAVVNVKNMDGNLTYMWTADGVEVGTSKELILTFAHFGKEIACKVSNGTTSVVSNAVEVTSKDFSTYGYEVPASGGLVYNIGNVTGEGDSSWEFKIDGKSFTILKTNNNDESTFFVIANDFYGTKSGTALSVAKWDVNDIDGLPGYINEELYADGIAPIHLPVGIGNSINRNHVWMTEASARATNGATEAYTITAGVVAPSYWEWRTYIDRIKVDIRPGVVTPYWFRTGYLDAYFRTLNSDAMLNGTNLLVGKSSDGTYNYFRGNILATSNGVGLVRPVFHLKKDFFKTAKIDLVKAGSNIINTMNTMYTNEELLNVYTKAELKAAGFDIGFSAEVKWTDGTNELSGLAGKSTIAAEVSVTSGEAADASADVIVALYDEDNNLVKVAKEPISIPAKQTAVKTVLLTGLTGVNDEYTVKAFVWNSLGGMKSIIDDAIEFQSGVDATAASIDTTTRSKVFFQ